MKICGSQANLQQLHDGFDLQDRPLCNDDTLAERSVLQVEAIMELQPYVFWWITSSSNREMAWLWELPITHCEQHPHGAF
jgi:hypothetical protein